MDHPPWCDERRCTAATPPGVHRGEARTVADHAGVVLRLYLYAAPAEPAQVAASLRPNALVGEATLLKMASLCGAAARELLAVADMTRPDRI